MKTIEEKAQAAWEDYTYPEGNLYSNVFKDAYKLGAKEALAGQWRSVENELPKDLRDVFVRFVNYTGGIEYGCACYDGEDWYTTDDTYIRPTHWMSIPEPPKDESHV